MQNHTENVHCVAKKHHSNGLCVFSKKLISYCSLLQIHPTVFSIQTACAERGTRVPKTFNEIGPVTEPPALSGRRQDMWHMVAHSNAVHEHFF